MSLCDLLLGDQVGGHSMPAPLKDSTLSPLQLLLLGPVKGLESDVEMWFFGRTPQ